VAFMTDERLADGWEVERAIRAALYHAAYSLDSEDFMAFLDWCAPAFSYRITTYSPEIRREMTWLDKDREGMHELLSTLSKHNRDRTPIVRHWSLMMVSPALGDNSYDVVSALQVYRTHTDGGVTSLYAVGRYLDHVVIEGDRALLAAREVRLETRMLGTGYHVPF